MSSMEPIENCLIFSLGKAYQRLTQATKRRLAPFGITPVQYMVLRALWEEDRQSGAALGDRLLLDSATLTGVLDRLEQSGLVQRQPDPADRRINRVVLTTQGTELQTPVEQVVQELKHDFFGTLSAEDTERLRAYLWAIKEPRDK